MRDALQRFRPGCGIVFAVVALAMIGAPMRASLARPADPAPSAPSAPAWGGGVRALLADLFWLRAYVAWERQDAAATEAWLTLTTIVDPRPIGFWLNGARMMAYDMPHWPRQEDAVGVAVPRAVRERRAELHAQRALQHLAAGRQRHPHEPALWVEEANLHLVRGDRAAAAAAYRASAKLPAAPPYAARVYAELLRAEGQRHQAYQWLTALHARLDAVTDAAEREQAMPELVLQRVRELERELGIPSGAAYVALGAQPPLTARASAAFTEPH